ncbi:hypothetical protein [Methylomonas koyamae]|uniref:hypothetical protein n=1 Tax=Methylomonas koyamae TaxID=702114 RepID=UPI000A600245|nr:hypothetical protein [Methylomonas koyamae]
MSEKKPPVLEVVKGAKPAEPAKTKKKGSGGGAGKGSANVVRFGEYGIEDGRFVQFKLMRTQGGGDRSEGSFPLCDFTCRIVEEIVADNELSEANFLRIEGKRADGIALPPVDVPMKAFFTNQGSWANDYWGTLPFIYPAPPRKIIFARAFSFIPHSMAISRAKPFTSLLDGRSCKADGTICMAVAPLLATA